MSRYAIVGGGGVFAVHLTKYLLQDNNTEFILSIGRNPPKSSAFTLDVGKGDPRFKYEQVHLVFEQDRLFELFDQIRPQYIINFAALAYATSWEKSFRYYETNVVAVAEMCGQLMKRNYLERFIQIGTSELYGSVSEPAKEDHPVHPTSPYAVSKLAADMHLETLWKVKGFPTNVIRPSNSYGPGQLLYRILPRAVYAGLTGQKLQLHGGGIVKKSYMHAYDLARAIDLVLKKAPLGRIYNVGPEESISMGDLVNLVAKGLSIDLERLVDITPGRSGEDAQYWLDSSRIKNELGYTETISLETGVRDMIDWGKRYLSSLHGEPMEFVLRA